MGFGELLAVPRNDPSPSGAESPQQRAEEPRVRGLELEEGCVSPKPFLIHPPPPSSGLCPNPSFSLPQQPCPCSELASADLPAFPRGREALGSRDSSTLPYLYLLAKRLTLTTRSIGARG